MTKSHIPAANAPAWIDVPKGQLENESKICLKCGRPISSKDITHRKKKIQRRVDTPKDMIKKTKVPIKAYDKQKAHEEGYGEQDALIETYIEQKTLEDVRNK